MSDAVERTIWINAPLSTVFAYFTVAEKMTEWCGVAARLEPVPGGVYELDMGIAGTFRGRFVEVVADERVVYEVDPPPGMDSPPSRVEITLTVEASGTRVSIVHSGLAGPFPFVAGRGWDHHLARLSVAVQGVACGPDPLCTQPMETLFEASDPGGWSESNS